jgi:putative ABC transport system substrate-binding protein
MNARRKLLVAIGASVLTTPLASLGQQQAKFARIGYLAADKETDNPQRLQAFRDGLHELGYVEGKNVVIGERTSSSSIAGRKGSTNGCPISPRSWSGSRSM